ncbi:MAG: alpha-ketoacid dehydrogenase subunit beta [Spirochaetota bacterium]|nr:MAG: alpha-ketoacid dehydrogenase subunit beta [Spirochaetota bacterium]
MRELTYREAVIEAIDEEMERDPLVFLMGEDIGEHWQGGCKEFEGLWPKYGSERVRETPISETAILGSAIGAAATGMRPIANIMFANFLGVPMDEIFNQLTKMKYMFGGKAKVPVTIHSISGGGLSCAAQHSVCVEGFLMSIPGLKIVSPATPYDAKGLLKSAIRDDNPVIYFEHLALLLGGLKGEVPKEDYTIPLGEADIKKEGSDVTVVAIANMVHVALAAADTLKKDGISVEVIDPRCIVPLDQNTIIESVKKTGKLVIIDEEPKTGSAASEISAVVAEEAMEYLDAPIKRVCAPNTPVPFSPVLEKFWMPDEEKLIKAINSIM